MDRENKQRYFDKDSIKREKIRLIFFPFLIVSLGALILSSVCYWYFVYELGKLDGQSFGIIIVFISAFIPFLIIKRLNLVEGSYHHGKFLWLLVAAPILVPGLFLQTYIDKSIGKLTEIDNVNEIKKESKTRFYTIDQYVLNTDIIMNFTYINNVRKSSKKYLETYCLVPVYGSEEAVLTTYPIAWIGEKYKSESFLPENQDMIFKKFVAESKTKFESDAKKKYDYFERITYNKDNGFYRSLEHLSHLSLSSQIILLPYSGIFKERAGKNLEWAILIYFISSIVFMITLFLSPFNEIQLNAFLAGQSIYEYNLSQQKPSLVVRGKNVSNDKIIIVKKTPKDKLHKELKEVCKLYNSDGGKMYPRLTEMENEVFTITFPFDIDFEPLCYLLNYICYPAKGGKMPDVTGWTKAVKGDTWITDEIEGKNIMIYVPENDNEHDNVFITTEDNKCYKFDFTGETQIQTEVIRKYCKPEYTSNSITTIKPGEDFF